MLSTKYLQVGDTVRVAPMGLRCRISYNSNGVVSRIVFIDSSDVEWQCALDESIALQKYNVVPSRLVNKTACQVEGILSFEGLSAIDVVNTGVDKAVQGKILDKNEQLYFKAYNLTDSRVQYGAYQQVTQLSMMGFNVCPGFVYSADMSQSKVEKLPVIALQYPFISGYEVVSKGNVCSFVNESCQFSRVESVARDVNSLGNIVAKVTCADRVQFTVPYNQIVKYNVQKNTVVAYEDDGIVYSTDKSNRAKKVDADIHCSCCGAAIHVKENEPYCRCSYSNCMSMKYPVVENMIKLLGLAPMSYVTYRKYVDNGQLTSICDIFDVTENSSIEVHCTLPTLLRALCPVYVVRSADFFDRMCKCAGSTDATMHYLQNPDDIYSDMHTVLSKVCLKNFISWIKDPENLLVVKTFVEMPNIHLQESSVHLDVPPLFRNKVIYLEGTFNHGSYMDVSSILSCYGATVTTTLDNRCNCVVVGGLVKNPDSLESVKIAVSYDIPVYQERIFFEHYGIDADIENANKLHSC